jgi:hypothetical protein
MEIQQLDSLPQICEFYELRLSDCCFPDSLRNGEFFSQDSNINHDETLFSLPSSSICDVILNVMGIGKYTILTWQPVGKWAKPKASRLKPVSTKN